MDAALLAARWPEVLHVEASEVAACAARTATTFIVLDDDPTGTQSVRDLPVLTGWSPSDIQWALEQQTSAIYILTNTRSLDPDAVASRLRAIVDVTLDVAAALRRRVAFVSRADSTLRGHHPLETDVIAATAASHGAPKPDGIIIVPAYPEAGRVTIGGVHYHRTGDTFTPVGETEFARDATFGFQSSRLDDWVEEKTGGRVPAAQVVTLDLATIRQGPQAIVAALDGVRDGQTVTVDAVVEDDLRLVSLGLAHLEARGRTFLSRVGPPFVRARIGQPISEPLCAAGIPAPLDETQRGGLVVVGSHVALTTRQLQTLRRERPTTTGVELDATLVVDGAERDSHVDDTVRQLLDVLDRGDDAILQTSRRLVTGSDPDASLAIARAVSAALVEVVRQVVHAAPPAFVVAKGGITSSDVATHGLGIVRAFVRGPMLPGIVSLWEPAEGPARGIPYVVFAGNVGSDDSLHSIVESLTAARSSRPPGGDVERDPARRPSTGATD